MASARTCTHNRRVLQQLDVNIHQMSCPLIQPINTNYVQYTGKHKPQSGREREREMFYLTTHSTHFIYGYMASDIWLRTILIVRKETRCRHIGYSYRLTARVLLYAPSHRQDNTYHSLCYTSHGALAGTRPVLGVVLVSDLSSTIILSRCYNDRNFFVQLTACSM